MGILLEAPSTSQVGQPVDLLPTTVQEQVTSTFYYEARSLKHHLEPEVEVEPYINWAEIHLMLSRMTEAAACAHKGAWDEALANLTGVR